MGFFGRKVFFLVELNCAVRFVWRKVSDEISDRNLIVERIDCIILFRRLDDWICIDDGFFL